MPKCFQWPCRRQTRDSLRDGLNPSRAVRGLTAVSVILVLVLQTACILPWFKKKKAAPAIPPTVRVAFLPFNAPMEDEDVRWAALAAPIRMAKISERVRDFEVVPLWESMPVALEAAGASRTLNRDTSAAVASWLTAKWAVMGEFTRTKRGISMMIDFIPARSTLVPFRFVGNGNLDSVGSEFPMAFVQFARYLLIRPLVEAKREEPRFTSLRELAEALDREYGWFVAAQPGRTEERVKELQKADERLARLLFNPATYPILAQTK